MQISEIIKDSFTYPFSDKRQFGLITLVFLFLTIFMSGSFIAFIYFIEMESFELGLLIFIISIVVFLLVSIFLGGYQLDIVKVACEQDEEMPVFNPKENVKNGLKAIIVYLVYYVIAGIISTICAFTATIFLATGEQVAVILAMIINLISIIIDILITWIFSMSLTRLAYYSSLNEGLELKEAYNDLRKIGLLNMLVFVIVMGLILGIISIIALGAVTSIIQTFDDMVFDILIFLVTGLLVSYLGVVFSRAMGLLYSKVVFDE